MRELASSKDGGDPGTEPELVLSTSTASWSTRGTQWRRRGARSSATSASHAVRRLLPRDRATVPRHHRAARAGGRRRGDRARLPRHRAAQAPRVPAFPGIHTALARLDARREARRRDLQGAPADVLDARAVRRPVRERADARTGRPGKPAPFPLLVAASEARIDVARASSSATWRSTGSPRARPACASCTPPGATARAPRVPSSCARRTTSASSGSSAGGLERQLAAALRPAEALLFVALRELWNGFCSHEPSFPGRGGAVLPGAERLVDAALRAAREARQQEREHGEHDADDDDAGDEHAGALPAGRRLTQG